MSVEEGTIEELEAGGLSSIPKNAPCRRKTVILDWGEGPSGPCPNVSDGELAPGEEFEDCTLFLVDPGITPAVVSFLRQPEGAESEFVNWAVPS